jgi:Ankyrin repeats (3 copies)
VEDDGTASVPCVQIGVRCRGLTKIETIVGVCIFLCAAKHPPPHSFLPTTMLSSQSFLYSSFSKEDPEYFTSLFAPIANNPILTALHASFRPASIVDYMHAGERGYIYESLSSFSAEELEAAEDVLEYWQFPKAWTKAVLEELAFKQGHLTDSPLREIAADGCKRLKAVFETDVTDLFTASKILYIDSTQYIRNAAYHGELDLLNYLHGNGCPWDEYTCTDAAMNGHLDCLKYAHENGCPWSVLTCSEAAKNGHMDCLKYLHENGCRWNETTSSNAAKNGHLDCLKYAHENGCPWNKWTCSEAAWNGHLECLKYAHENGCPWNKRTCSEAAWNGHLECLKYAHENGCPWNG